VSYRLTMSSEIRDWLKDLGGSDSQAATLAGEALTALIAEGAELGPPLVVPMAGSTSPEELMELLDDAYQHRLEGLGDLRRGVAEAATLAVDIRRRIAELEPDQPDPAARGKTSDELNELHELRNLLPGVTAAERDLAERNRRAQTEVDAFRTRKEVLKARCIAAQAEARVDETIRMIGNEPADRGDRLRDVTIEIERELRPQAWSELLMELRPAAAVAPSAPVAPGAPAEPADRDLRILFAVQPPGTALLLSVVEGRDAIAQHREQAVRLSARVLRRVRAGEDPEASACCYDDEASFLGDCYPDTAEAIAAGAQVMVAANQRRTLAEQRRRLGLRTEDIAARMGVRPDRVSTIENEDPGALDVRTLERYVEALGGRLEVVADVAGQRVAIR
jgi:Helix-turn-helix